MIDLNIFKTDEKTESFNKRITDLAVISMILFVIPLIVYINLVSGRAYFYHPVTIVSNYTVLFLLIGVIPVFSKTPYRLKRILFFIVTYFTAIKSVVLSNMEFLYAVVILIVSYTLLTSNKKTSLAVFTSVILMYVLTPVLNYYHVVSFYYDAETFHGDIRIISIRAFEAVMGLSFMSALIFFVFKNNKKNIALLQKKVNETDLLNDSLVMEVADRKKAELAAEDYATNFKTLFDSSFDGYMILDDDFNILEINQSVIDISGFTKEELIGKSNLEFLAPQEIEVAVKRRERLELDERVPDFKVEVKSKAGDILILQTQTVKIQRKGEVKYLVILKDVTEQTIVLEKLCQSEELHRNLFEQTNDSILIMNGNELVDCNLKAMELYPGFRGNEVSIPYVVPDREFDDINGSVNLSGKISLALQGETQTYEWVHKSPKLNEPIYTLVNLKALRELGDKYYMVVEKNITDRKRSQNLVLNSIIQTEENERKRISSDLHDGIGPILTTIKLYAQALVDEKLPEKQDLIKTKLIDLVDEAVNSTSEISFNISPHILVNYGIVAAVESFISKFNLSEKFEIEFVHNEVKRFEENKEITVYRLFTELINNTLKHAKASRVFFGIEDTNCYIRLHYKDDGNGFNTDMVTKKSGGMGLGNMKYRVESFNGEFLLHSLPDKGMEVKITLPKGGCI